MVIQDPQKAAQLLKMALQPWHDSVAKPIEAQENVLKGLLGIYAKTDYGQQHGAGKVSNITDYRRSFPVITYEDVKPMVEQVMAGEIKLLLDEAPVGWAITRGTTGDKPKFIPMTPNDLRMRVSAGRAMMNYAASGNRFDLFRGVNLNLNFPSVVGKVKVGEKELEYGYSSGIYVKLPVHPFVQCLLKMKLMHSVGERPLKTGKNGSNLHIRNVKTKM
jgi:hypothetical protein